MENKNIALLIFLSTLFLPLMAQTVDHTSTIIGKLVNNETKEPLFGANILLTKINDSSFTFGTSTDEDGRFIIRDIDTGYYVLRASYIGFKLLHTTINASEQQIY